MRIIRALAVIAASLILSGVEGPCPPPKPPAHRAGW
jgi:hypothetical protein